MAEEGSAPVHFLLVHGTWQGPWSWHLLIPLLEQRGHKVSTVTLPAHCTDFTPPETVTSLEIFTAPVRKALEDAPGKVILVGHSLGGMVCSVVAEALPDKVSKIVYMAALLLPDGMCGMAYSTFDPRKLEDYMVPIRADPENEDSPVLLMGLSEGGIEHSLMPKCSRESQTLAKLLYRPALVSTFVTPLHVTDARWGQIPRYFIFPEEDECVSVKLQRHFVETLGVTKEWTIPGTDHELQMSNPKACADVLLEIARL